MRNLHELQIKTAVEAVASRKEVNEVLFRGLRWFSGSANGRSVFI